MEGIELTKLSTSELANQLNTTKDVILSNARKCFPCKIIEHGKTTYWTKSEVTILLDYMKERTSNNRSVEFNSTVNNISTELTPALKIRKAMLLMQEGYEEELAIQRERAETAERKLLEQKPKADVYDSICNSATLQDLQTVSQTIGMKNIFKVLTADNVLELKYTQDNIRYYKPFARYADYLVIKDGKAWKDNNGIEHIRPRVFVTGKGLIWLTKRYGTL